MDWAYVNPFTGYIHFENFKFHENKSDSSFLACSGISLHLNIRKLFSKEYEIKDLTLNKPIITVIQHSKKEYNFSDLITKFSPKPDKPGADTTPVHFSLLDIKVMDGTFRMKEEMTPANYSIINVELACSGKRWNADTINTKFSFNSGIGSGHIEGFYNLNTKSSLYATAVLIQKLDLKILELYTKELSNYGSTRAFIDANMKATGSMKDERDVDATGFLAISDFHFGKTPQDDFASFDKFVLVMNKSNPLKKVFLIDSISLTHPYFKYEKYDHLDNIEKMFGKGGSKVKAVAQDPEKFNLVIEIARYVKLLSKDFLQSEYKINRLGVYKADIHYEDYSGNEKFAVAADPLSLIADSINSNKKRVKILLNTGIKPFGNFQLVLSINPKDSSDFDMSYHLENLNATLFNPFLVSKTTFPLDRGSIEFKGAWSVRNGVINSTNHLVVVDPRISKRIKNNQNKWLPLKVIMFFVRERGNAIDYEIPITGNLKDPKLHFSEVITDIITNIFVKPATVPYSYKIRTVENKVEKTLAFNWQLRSSELMPDNAKFIDNVVDFLKNNSKVSISVYPVQFMEKEKECILFFEAKKDYYLKTHNKDVTSFQEADSTYVEKMSPKDSLFVQFIDKQVRNKLLFTVQEKCLALIGEQTVARKYEKLLKTREEVFKAYFTKAGTSDRVKIKQSISKVPFNGFSYYKIGYNGAIPPETLASFEKLNELDNEKPREKLKDERKKARQYFLKKE
jgi:hypothetical protein